MTTTTQFPKSLTAFKRAVRVGTRLQCVEQSELPYLVGRVRVITKTQGNGYYAFHEDDPEQDRLWGVWPKASEVLWCHDGALSYTRGKPGSFAFVTLRILGQGE